VLIEPTGFPRPTTVDPRAFIGPIALAPANPARARTVAHDPIPGSTPNLMSLLQRIKPQFSAVADREAE